MLCRRSLPALALLLFIALGSAACGSSGGGDSSSSDSGSVALKVTPEILNVDGVAFVEANFSGITYDDLDTQGLTLKLLVPNHLELVIDSAALTLESGAMHIEPIFAGHAPDGDVQQIFRLGNIQEAANETEFQFSFYVFSFPASVLHQADHGKLNLQFHVVGKPTADVIMADLERGAITEFDAKNADFDDEATLLFQVSE